MFCYCYLYFTALKIQLLPKPKTSALEKCYLIIYNTLVFVTLNFAVYNGNIGGTKYVRFLALGPGFFVSPLSVFFGHRNFASLCSDNGKHCVFFCSTERAQ